MAEVIHYLSYCIGYNYECSVVSDFSVAPRHKPSSLDKAYLFFAQQLLTDLVELMKAATPHLRVLVLGDVVKVVGACMMTKCILFQLIINKW
jgi:hypothetical protein